MPFLLLNQQGQSTEGRKQKLKSGKEIWESVWRKKKKATVGSSTYLRALAGII